ncbi:MAG: peptidoglycan editing factor PgeF [Ectothiorhodospiraceae bacterium]|nr:peptidoglycan editing factor PgeF [Chromatiales bacterium]MCP5157161.1 peptidoglycan editing factor PgeF [Ectothiorhodospiraceae bacterium]
MTTDRAVHPPLDLVRPSWPAPAWVRAVATTRGGGVSVGPFASLNLGGAAGDDPASVGTNRDRLRAALDLPAEPCWLAQEHGTTVVEAGDDARGAPADGSVAHAAGVVCAVLTADCLPVLLVDTRNRAVAAVHAGWRGLAAGVLERGVDALAGQPTDVLAWIGPAIGPAAYEVGDEVRHAFVSDDPLATAAFRPSPRGRWLADLPALGRARLARAGVTSVHGGEHCTLSAPDRFFSYRRDGTTGRMATLIWITR